MKKAQVKYSDFEIVTKLGSGSFGVVYKVKQKRIDFFKGREQYNTSNEANRHKSNEQITT